MNILVDFTMHIHFRKEALNISRMMFHYFLIWLWGAEAPPLKKLLVPFIYRSKIIPRLSRNFSNHSGIMIDNEMAPLRQKTLYVREKFIKKCLRREFISTELFYYVMIFSDRQISIQGTVLEPVFVNFSNSYHHFVYLFISQQIFCTINCNIRWKISKTKNDIVTKFCDHLTLFSWDFLDIFSMKGTNSFKI